jgi:hypothetical protein
MKIYLASFLQKENFGPGRVISINHGKKPDDVEVQNIYFPLTPPTSLIQKYNDEALEERQKGIKSKDGQAGPNFEKAFREQLQKFVDSVLEAAAEEKKTPEELLPFQEGDTLCSWERSYNQHYRATVAEYLTKMGFDVIQN